MICKEYDELSVEERTTYIGKIVHAVQSDRQMFQFGKYVIELAKIKGLFENVIINPPSEDKTIQQ